MSEIMGDIFINGGYIYKFNKLRFKKFIYIYIFFINMSLLSS